MKKSNFYLNKIIPNPAWKNVRDIYRKLSEEFNVLTDSFGIEINPETKKNLNHLIIVIDEVDQCVDELPDRSSRDSITSSLIQFLENDDENWFHPDASESLISQIEIIKIIILKLEIAEEFISAARTIFKVTELKRHTTKLERLLELIATEGRSTARLPLSILNIDSKEKFGVFFTRLCMIMGFADLIFDAKKDFKKGQINFKPSIKLYSKLIYIVITKGLKLILSFPNKIKFLAYCFRFTIALIRE